MTHVERQKVNIIRAATRDPDVLFLLRVLDREEKQRLDAEAENVELQMEKTNRD